MLWKGTGKKASLSIIYTLDSSQKYAEKKDLCMLVIRINKEIKRYKINYLALDSSASFAMNNFKSKLRSNLQIILRATCIDN